VRSQPLESKAERLPPATTLVFELNKICPFDGQRALRFIVEVIPAEVLLGIHDCPLYLCRKETFGNFYRCEVPVD